MASVEPETLKAWSSRRRGSRRRKRRGGEEWYPPPEPNRGFVGATQAPQRGPGRTPAKNDFTAF